MGHHFDSLMPDKFAMRPRFYRPSKRFYHSYGETIALVIGLVFLVLVVIVAFFLYQAVFSSIPSFG